EPWHNAQSLPACVPRDGLKAFGEQCGIAAKLVDEKAAYPIAIFRGENCMCADETGDHAAAVDVADEHGGGTCRFSTDHIRDIPFTQIGFRRAAGTLDQNEVAPARDLLETFENGAKESCFSLAPLLRRHVAASEALDNDLRTLIGLRLQQDWVHVDGWREP